MRGKRLRRGEGLVGAEKGDELGLDLLAVEIAGEVEEIGFEHRLAFAEGRARADIARSLMARPSMVDAHGVDAVAHVLARRELEVERGEAEPLAAAGALADAAAHAPPIAELRRPPPSPRRDARCSRMRLDEKVRPACADRRDDIDAEAEHAAERGKFLGRAGAALAVGEVMAHHDMARA